MNQIYRVIEFTRMIKKACPIQCFSGPCYQVDKWIVIFK